MKKWLTFGMLIGFAIGVVTTYFVKKHYLKAQSNAAYAYGLSLLEKRNIDKAVAVLNQSIGLNLENHKPYISLGKIYEKEGKHELAIESYRKALEICGDDEKLERADKKFVEERILQISKKTKWEKWGILKYINDSGSFACENKIDLLFYIKKITDSLAFVFIFNKLLFCNLCLR